MCGGLLVVARRTIFRNAAWFDGTSFSPMVLLITILLFFPSLPHQASELAERFNRAMELQRQGALKEAAEEYRAVLKRAPNYAEAQANLGAVLARLGDYEEAIAAYEAAYRLKPELTPILLNLGIAHYRAGQFAKAAEVLGHFLSVAPGHEQARQLLGVSLVELGRDAEAITYLEPAISSPQAEVTALYSLGLAYLRSRRGDVGGVAKRLAAREDGAALSLLLQGQSHLEEFAFEKGATDLEAAAKLSADLPRINSLLGLAYFKLGRLPEARERLERELSQAPDDFLTLYYLASLLEKQNDLDSAGHRIEAALAQQPQSVEALTLAGSVFFKQGRTAESVRALERATREQPDNSEARYLLARGYQKLGRKLEAAREFKEVERLKARANEREKERKPDQ
jgi:tetratricopeptide (TPR) repeat protein